MGSKKVKTEVAANANAVPEALKIHEVANINPKPTDEEYADLKESVRLSGLLYPIKAWKDEKGREWLIDGRNRQRVVIELLSEGIAQAANGKPIEMWIEWIEGDKGALFEAALASSIRRNLTTGQRAMMIVRAAKLEVKYRGKGKGDLAKSLAAKVETNRQYVIDCGQIDEFDLALADQVLAGVITVPEAKRRMEKAKLGEADTEAPQPSKRGVKDGLKRPVPEELEHIFQCRADYMRVMSNLRKAKEDIKQICGTAGGATVPQKEMLAELQHSIKALGDYMPHVPCCWCSGTGVSQEDSGQPCGHCKATLYLDKIQYRLVPDDLRPTKEDGSAIDDEDEDEDEGEGETEGEGGEGDGDEV
jgi:hypothetical protein